MKMDELGFEPKTFRMQSEHSTPELHALDNHYEKVFLFLSFKMWIIYKRTLYEYSS